MALEQITNRLSNLCEKSVHPIVTDKLQCQMQDLQSNPPSHSYSNTASASFR